MKALKDVGVTLPMMSNKHAYVVTDVVKELKGHEGHIPNLRFFDEALYITTRRAVNDRNIILTEIQKPVSVAPQ